MRVVWKYKLDFGLTKIELPPDAQPLRVGEQDQILVMWTLLESKAEKTMIRRFYAYETGEELRAARQQFIGTVQFKRGGNYYCYHIFEFL